MTYSPIRGKVMGSGGLVGEATRIVAAFLEDGAIVDI